MDLVGIGKAELTRLTGDSRRNVQNWLGGTTIPAAFLVRFVEAIPTNLEWLLTGKGEPDPTPQDRKAQAFDMITGVVQAAAYADPREIQRILDALDAIRLAEGQEGGGR
jgi:hypothetical protein